MATAIAPRIAAPVETRRRRIDVVTVLTVWLAVVFVVPSRFVVTALGGAGRLDRLIGVGLLVWWLIHKAVPAMTNRQRHPIRVVLLLFTMSWLASAAAAFARGLSTLERSGIERSLLSMLATSGVVLAMADGIESRERLETLLKRVTYFACFTAFVASLQFFFRFDLNPYLQPPGLGLNYDLFGIESRSALNRVSGTGVHAIEYGAVLAMIFPIAVHFALHATTRLESQIRWAIAGYIGVAGLFSISRTNAIALVIVGSLMIAVWRGRQRFNAVIVTVFGLVAVRAVISGLLGTIKNLFLNLENDPSIEGRTQDYDIAFAYVDERPWVGRGPGTWSKEEYIVLDNQWLGTLITRGWIGVAVLVLVFGTTMLLARRVLNTARDDGARHLAQALFAGLVMSFTVLFFFDAFAFPQFSAMLLFCWGATCALWAIEQRNDPNDVRVLNPGVMKPSKSTRGRRPPRRPVVVSAPDHGR